MAIVDGVKNAVTAQVAARANQSIRAGLTKVAGNLLGINTSFSGPQLGAQAPRFTPTKYTTESLAYPLDVEEDTRQGHYIFFNINEQNKARIAKQKFISETRHHERMIDAEYQQHLKKFHEGTKATGFGAFAQLRSKEEIKADYIKKHVIENYDASALDSGSTGTPTSSRKESSSLQLQNPTTIQLKTAIALYMPPSVQVSYGAEYNDTGISVRADIGAGIIQAFKEGANAKETAIQALDKFDVGMKVAAIAALDLAAPGSKAIAQIQTGRAITPKMELMFSGIGRRDFSYEFNFIPKSREEADMVKRIVYQFKYHMASDFIEGSGMREMEIPSTFDIQYQYLGDENKNLNRISTCFLESVEVAYGGDRFQAYEGGVPQQTKLSLKFKEMEIITKSRIEEGY